MDTATQFIDYRRDIFRVAGRPARTKDIPSGQQGRANGLHDLLEEIALVHAVPVFPRPIGKNPEQ